MKRRMLLVALVLLLPLAACGSDQEPAMSAADTSVEVAFDEPLKPGPVTWRVTLTAGEDLELEFPDGQRADVSLSQEGEVVYEWSRSQMFTQVLGEESVAAGESLTFELEDVLEVDPGEYELRARITAGEGLDAVRQVTVEPR